MYKTSVCQSEMPTSKLSGYGMASSEMPMFKMFRSMSEMSDTWTLNPESREAQTEVQSVYT